VVLLNVRTLPVPARLSDEELIAETPANTSLSHPIPQMQIQRRLNAPA
jgi:hypothetical protein